MSSKQENAHANIFSILDVSHRSLTGLASAAHAVLPRGIRGIVADSGGGAVGGAKVTVTDEATGISRATLTNGTGEYVFNSVDPKTCMVVVESPGFKKFERKGVVIGTQQFVTLDVKLEVGQLTESVLVTEEVPLIESSDASNGQVLDRQKMVDLPNLGRNPFLLSKLSTSVVVAGDPRFNRFQDQSGSSQISVAGGPVRGNNYLLDGVPITDFNNRAVIIPSIEAVEEMKLQVNTYDAEMGRTGGGVLMRMGSESRRAVTGRIRGCPSQEFDPKRNHDHPAQLLTVKSWAGMARSGDVQRRPRSAGWLSCDKERVLF